MLMFPALDTFIDNGQISMVIYPMHMPICHIGSFYGTNMQVDI